MIETKAPDGSVRTMFLYRPNNQAEVGTGTAFSNFLIYYGNYQKFFESYFDGDEDLWILKINY